MARISLWVGVATATSTRIKLFRQSRGVVGGSDGTVSPSMLINVASCNQGVQQAAMRPYVTTPKSKHQDIGQHNLTRLFLGLQVGRETKEP